MTILHVLNMGGYSGAENVVINIIRAFRERNPEVRFVYVSPDGEIRPILEENGIEFEPIAKRSVGEIRRVIKKYNPDLIHAHDFTASINCAFAARKKIPVISHIHQNSPWLGSVNPKSALYALSCPRYSQMLGVSPSVFSEFIFGKRFAEKEEVIGNPVIPSRIRLLAKEAEDQRSFDVIALGRLEDEKKPLRFVSLISRLVRERGKTFTAAMIGIGDLQPEIEKAIADEGLEDVITLTGFLRNPYGILSHAKVLCMTSAWEGFGLVAVEALSLGKPVAATPVGGLPTILTPDGSEGQLCSTDDEFIAYLSAMLDGGEPYRTACAAAFRRADELDNTHEYIEKLAGIYGL